MTTPSSPIDGRAYLRALSYALLAVPSDDDHAELQHVTFIGDRVVGSDGVSRHDGYFFTPVGETVSVARLSAKLLQKALEYAQVVSRKRPEGTFTVEHVGEIVRIKYGARLPIEHELAVVDVGYHPKTPREWVAPDAPINPNGMEEVATDRDMMSLDWYQAWDKHHGTSRIRGGLDGGPVRRDITSNGKRVATAFVLPENHAPAEIREVLPLEAMWDGNKKQEPRGRSNLDLVLDHDGEPADGARYIEIDNGGEVYKVNVTGLEDWSELLKKGPCSHRQEEVGCPQCTDEAVQKARVAKAEAESKPKRRRRKAGDDAEAGDGFQPNVSDTTH